MAKTKRTYPEINDIRDDLESLKSNVVELTRHVQENGSEKAQKNLQKLQVRSRREMQKLEQSIKKNPAQSLAMAFAAGFVASLLLRGRG